MELFKSTGVTAIVNDDLTETALALISLMVGVLTAVVGYVYGKILVDHGTWPTILAGVGK